MTSEQVAFRALLYRECWRQRLTCPAAVEDLYDEMGDETPAGALLVFTCSLTAGDWVVIGALEMLEREQQQLMLLALYDPDRLEVCLHALDLQPPLAPGYAAEVLARWSEVRAAMASFDLLTAERPHLAFDDPRREHYGRLGRAARAFILRHDGDPATAAQAVIEAAR